jgi:hypothetical protein
MTPEQIHEIPSRLKKGECIRAEYEHDGYIQMRYLDREEEYEVKIESVSIYDKPTESYTYFAEKAFLAYLAHHSTKIEMRQ